MKLVIDAVFEDGAFYPTTSQSQRFANGQHVRLTVKNVETPTEMLGLLTSVYTGLSAAEIDAIENIALDRRPFFEERVVE